MQVELDLERARGWPHRWTKLLPVVLARHAASSVIAARRSGAMVGMTAPGSGILVETTPPTMPCLINLLTL